ncbi:MAG: twin-arginine translocase TatA/TatE family subunit [Bacteroidales bacterium]|nr:twin-arginine translocase TatA/TatE family subunit [Bacteroidales bacterium]
MLLFIGTQELIIVGIVILVLFGSKEIPNIVKGYKEVKKVKDDITTDIVKETKIIKDIKDLSNTLKK